MRLPAGNLSRLRKLFVVATLSAFLGGAFGCASKASDGECEAACDNVVAVGMTELEAKMSKDPDLEAAGETGRELVKKQAEALLKAINESCMSECSKKGTQKQAECLKSASNTADFANCK